MTVFDNLQVSACYQGAPIKRVGNSVVPNTVHDVSILPKILDNFCMLSNEGPSCRRLLNAISTILDSLEGSINEDKKQTAKFLQEQVLPLAKERIQYSSQVMVFASILYTLSEHAYKLLARRTHLLYLTLAQLGMYVHLFKCVQELSLQIILSFTIFNRDSNARTS